MKTKHWILLFLALALLCGIAALPKFVRAEKEKKKAGDGR